MKYIKVSHNILWGKSEITKSDLVEVLQGRTDTILKLDDLTYFDAEANAWKPIPHD